MPTSEEQKLILDITAPALAVEIKIRSDGAVIWVNVDDICRLRICRIPKLILDDQRSRGD